MQSVPFIDNAARSQTPACCKLYLGVALVWLSLLFADQAWAVAPIEVVALFKDRAVLRTSSSQQMLKVGETSDFGATLLSADPYGAKVRYANEVYDLSLSTRVSSRFSKRTEDSVRINRDSFGQYRISGQINGHYANFLVDTGASVVAMSETHATSMGLNYLQGRPGNVETAQGITSAYFLNLDEVKIAGITRHGVRATVILGSYPVEVLLGMSFLRNVSMQDEAGVLTLTAKY